MRHVTDAMVDAAVDARDAERTMLEAFRSLGEGGSAMQERIRTEAGGTKLSTLGAVIPHQGYAGAKVYTTIAGQFSFVILLFDAKDGRPLASFDAAAITRLRTAATSMVASRYLARRDAATLGLFGAGTQGRAHVLQFAREYPLTEIRVFDPHVDDSVCDEMARNCGIPVRRSDAESIAGDSDIIVTASRSKLPLFSGASLKAGCFIAAIGSSLPNTRELDDIALSRATRIAVDWSPQTLREAGDLVMASPEAIAGKVVDLADVITGKVPGRTSDNEITLYKSVGVGLQDIALAGLVWSRLP